MDIKRNDKYKGFVCGELRGVIFFAGTGKKDTEKVKLSIKSKDQKPSLLNFIDGAGIFAQRVAGYPAILLNVPGNNIFTIK